jgi:hypothetical protein
MSTRINKAVPSQWLSDFAAHSGPVSAEPYDASASVFDSTERLGRGFSSFDSGWSSSHGMNHMGGYMNPQSMMMMQQQSMMNSQYMHMQVVSCQIA